MKKVYLHIGPHKTGTTFLQKVFEENKHILSDNDVDYLEFGKVYFGHHDMALALNHMRYENGQLRNAINESRCDSILLSSENFDVLKPTSIEFMRNELKEFEVEILAFYRTPTTRLYSWWQEEIKHGKTIGFSEYVYEHYSKPFSSEVLNINIMLNRYIDAFGTESIKLFDYEDCLKGEGLLKVFLNHIGYHGDLNVVNERVNDGLSMLHIETIRALNVHARSKGELKFYNVRDAYLRKWNKTHPIMKNLESIQMKNNLKVSYGDTYLDKLLKKATLDKYREAFVTNISKEYNEKSVIIPESNWLVDSEAQKIIKKIYSVIMP